MNKTPALPDYRNNAFDFIRWFAAFEVMILHYSGYARIARAGAQPGLPQSLGLLFLRRFTEGVPPVVIFFAVSGFLTAASRARSGSAAEFLRRRLLRIYPTLWICVAVYAAVMAVVLKGAADGSFFRWLAVSVTGAAYTPSCMKSFGTGSVNGTLWMIGVLVQLYLITAAAGQWLSVRKARGWGLIFAACAAANLFCGYAFAPGMQGPGAKLMERTAVPYALYYFAGAAAYYNRQQVLPLLKKAAPYCAAGLFLWRILVISAGFAEPGYYAGIVTAVLTVSAALGAAYALPAGRIRSDLTYELYLMHWLILNFFVEYGLTARRHWFPWMALFLALSLGAAFGLKCAASFLKSMAGRLRLRKNRNN